MARFFVSTLLVGLMVSGASVVYAQDYPSKPIRIVTNNVGGGSDYISRLIAAGISGSLGQNVIVDNRPSGVIPIETVAKSMPDGYTVLVAGSGLLTTPFVQNTSYDPIRDFSPITLVSIEPSVVVVHPSLPVKSTKELIALAKSKPGALNYGSGSTGGSGHLAAELFKAMADGIDIVRVPYKGTALIVNALLGGEVQIIFEGVPGIAPHVKSGRLRAVAITSMQPSPLLPGVPPVAAALPGYEAVSFTGIWAPAKTPESIISRLNQEVVRFLKTAEAKEKLFSVAQDVVASSPDEFAAKIKVETTRWGKVIKDAGIKAN